MRKKLPVFLFTIFCMITCSFVTVVYASETMIEETADSIDTNFEDTQISTEPLLEVDNTENATEADTEEADFTSSIDTILFTNTSYSNVNTMTDTNELSEIDPESLHNFNKNFFEGTVTLADTSAYATTWAIIPVKNGLVSVPSSATVPGTTAKYVKLLQCCLNALGYNAGSADGIYGTNTKNAIIRFQKNNNLSADGIAGENTWRKVDVLIDKYQITVSSYVK